ncbi:MAG: complex I NDUFA9 subunit family protein [Rickettsiales bacterium]|nr:complex I NDUFA9 subunit family protein [Rickettsiales bacterium]
MSKKILIFGGSGFIGSDLTTLLLKEKNNVCIVCRDTDKAKKIFGENKNLEIKNIDIFNKEELEDLSKNYDVIINLIGKLFESKKGDFKKFHHDFPKLLTQTISKSQHLIHISALGIENSSATSLYAKTKLDGEKAIISNCKNYNIIKPSIVFGAKDNFFNQFANMAKISPFLPAIGGGKTKFAPVYVADLNQAILELINNPQRYQNQIFESYGPLVSSFKELLEFILKTTHKKRLLLPIPFFAAKIQAKFLNLLRIFLLTSDQVELLKYDNISQNNHNNIDILINQLGNYRKIAPTYLK